MKVDRSKKSEETLKPVWTERAPDAIGPYSQAMNIGEWVFTSGQIPLRVDGTVAPGGISEQTTQVLDNLEAVLLAAGVTLDKVVKTTVFVKDLEDFSELNAVYAARFGDHKPARSTIEVARLPRDVLVEIEAVAKAESK